MVYNNYKKKTENVKDKNITDGFQLKIAGKLFLYDN